MWGFAAHGIGCLVLTKMIYDVCYWVYACFIRPAKNLKKEFGEWAIVTGATDGIGKAMAIELSKKGMKVLLISRTQEKLEATLKELKGEGAVVAIDYNNFDDAAKAKLKKALDGKDIGVLINNVGISYEFPEYFDQLEDDRVQKLITLNVSSTAWMTKLVLPYMTEKKKGAVVNIASSAGVFTVPLYCAYGGAKKFIIHFTNSLYSEYKAKGVHFQVQTPHLVTTKLSKVKRPSFSVPDEQAYAKSAIKCIGYERELSPYWVHWAMLGVLSKIPMAITDQLSMMSHLPLRKRALAKRAELAKVR